MWKLRWPGSVRISVLRHGESENNLLGINCTSPRNKDLYGLTEQGVAQIESVAAEPQSFDLVLHSPLRRAEESARILSRAWGIAAVAEGLLIEVQMGIFENRPEADFQIWKQKTGLRSHPSGESPNDVDGRVGELLATLEGTYPSASLLLVTHGTLLLHLLSTVFDEIDWSAYCRKYANGRRLFKLRDYDERGS